MGFFSKIKEGLKKTKEAIAYKLNKLFTGGVLTDDFYDELEEILITSDIGAEFDNGFFERGNRQTAHKRHRKGARCA